MTVHASTPLPAVIGVVGAPRSGSTVLGAVLAARTGGFHVGELHLLWDRLATRRLCGCGLEVNGCPFWTAVWDKVEGTAGVETPEAACGLWAEAVRMRRAFMPGGAGVADRFGALMDATYEAVSELSGLSQIIDTSKHPGYFRTLARARTPIRLVQLTRDPRALAYSWSVPKPDPDQPGGTMPVRSPATVAAEWVGLNVAAGLAGRSFDDFHRIRYEDMVTDGVDAVIPPPAKQATVPDGRETGGDTSFGAHNDLAGGSGDVWNHTVAGNPLRMGGGDHELRLDTRWEVGLVRSHRLAVTALTAPLLMAYGYPVGG